MATLSWDYVPLSELDDGTLVRIPAKLGNDGNSQIKSVPKRLNLLEARVAGW